MTRIITTVVVGAEELDRADVTVMPRTTDARQAATHIHLPGGFSVFAASGTSPADLAEAMHRMGDRIETEAKRADAADTDEHGEVRS